MKKYFILFICLIGILFSSCVEKEDPYSWSIGQMEIDEPTPEVVTEEKIELPPATKVKSNVPYAVVLETKFMSSQMLMLVQIPDNPVSKYDFWKDTTEEHYAIIGIIYTDEDHHKVDGKVYNDYDLASAVFKAGYIKDKDAK